jgi:hypothetical protein
MKKIVTGIVALLSGALIPGPAQAARSETLTLRGAVAALPEAAEKRDGYQRSSFKHWIDTDRNGCDTRAEVLLAEAVLPAAKSGKCTVGAGSWYSYYDDIYAEEPKGLDIDHMVPLAEAWDSGASAWSAARREAYANDLGEPVALVAVSAKTNRSKADQDPGTWLPPYAPATCRYVTEWTTVKVRWGLSVDPAEHKALAATAAGCPNVPIVTAKAS